MIRRHALAQALTLAFALGASIVANTASAQPYPNRTIRIVLGFAPGAITDTIARAVANQMGKNMGQSVIVDNRAGGGGTIAPDAVARSAPDGYTLLLGESGGMSVNPLLMAKLSYDVAKDFAPIGQVVSLPTILVANASLGTTEVSKLAAIAVAKGPIPYGSPGPGTSQHLAMEQFRAASGIPLTHVPYRGGALAMNDLLAGQIPLMVVTVPTVAAQIKAGKIIPLVILGNTRSAVLPDVPTAREAGFTSYSAVSIWQGFFAPANTPKEIVTRLNFEIRKAVEAPEVRARLVAVGADIVLNSPEEFSKVLRDESAILATAIQTAGLKKE